MTLASITAGADDSEPGNEGTSPGRCVLVEDEFTEHRPHQLSRNAVEMTERPPPSPCRGVDPDRDRSPRPVVNFRVAKSPCCDHIDQATRQPPCCEVNVAILPSRRCEDGVGPHQAAWHNVNDPSLSVEMATERFQHVRVRGLEVESVDGAAEPPLCRTHLGVPGGRRDVRETHARKCAQPAM